MSSDSRLLTTGSVIPSLHYCDQPYITITDDDAWLVVMTTGAGKEGQSGQHVISMRSIDYGQSWSDPVAIEPADGPEASYAVLLKVPGGRIYAFYNHNTDRIREVPREDEGFISRVDSLGHYVFKFSDDHGRTWSAGRYEIPIRAFAIDLNNTTNGEVRFFWNVGRPLVTSRHVILPHSKIAAFGEGTYAQSEGAFLVSSNILTESDPEKITFETFPEGDIGLRTPDGGGRISEEQSVVELSDGSLYCVYRSTDGYPVCSYSRDSGRTWEPPTYKAYSPNGRRFKHSRAANFVWKCSNGKFLYWFHNHGGDIAARGTWEPYNDRNPVWLSAGHEIDTPTGKRLAWSQPEILLYEDDPFIRMSYPDLIETDGRFFIAETQKAVARIHEIDATLLDLLFSQGRSSDVARDGLILESATPQDAPMPKLRSFFQRDHSREDQAGMRTRNGITVDFVIDLAGWKPKEVVLSNMNTRRQGFQIATTDDGRLEILLADGRTESCWRSDAGWFRPNTPHHCTFVVDAGPGIVTVCVDGQLDDGGIDRQFGWGRFNSQLTHLNGSAVLSASPHIKMLRLYDRALRTSEAVGNFRALPRP